MNNHLILFTEEQGLVLVRLLLALIIGEFVLQTKSIGENKKMFSIPMLLHIIIIYILTALLSELWCLSVVIAVAHWLIDSFRIRMEEKYPEDEAKMPLFIAHQLLQLIIILTAWAGYFNLFTGVGRAVSLPFSDYKIALMALGYFIIIWPAGVFIKFATLRIAKHIPPSKTESGSEIEGGGRQIGQFERIIVLTLVLLNQYAAIGFLITGKSIIRFPGRGDDKLHSEYILVGTMMSYAIAILTGVLINWLLTIK